MDHRWYVGDETQANGHLGGFVVEHTEVPFDLGRHPLMEEEEDDRTKRTTASSSGVLLPIHKHRRIYYYQSQQAHEPSTRKQERRQQGEFRHDVVDEDARLMTKAISRALYSWMVLSNNTCRGGSDSMPLALDRIQELIGELEQHELLLAERRPHSASCPIFRSSPTKSSSSSGQQLRLRKKWKQIHHVLLIMWGHVILHTDPAHPESKAIMIRLAEMLQRLYTVRPTTHNKEEQSVLPLTLDQDEKVEVACFMRRLYHRCRSFTDPDLSTDQQGQLVSNLVQSTAKCFWSVFWPSPSGFMPIDSNREDRRIQLGDHVYRFPDEDGGDDHVDMDRMETLVDRPALVRESLDPRQSMEPHWEYADRPKDLFQLPTQAENEILSDPVGPPTWVRWVVDPKPVGSHQRVVDATPETFTTTNAHLFTQRQVARLICLASRKHNCSRFSCAVAHGKEFRRLMKLLPWFGDKDALEGSGAISAAKSASIFGYLMRVECTAVLQEVVQTVCFRTCQLQDRDNLDDCMATLSHSSLLASMGQVLGHPLVSNAVKRCVLTCFHTLARNSAYSAYLMVRQPRVLESIVSAFTVNDLDSRQLSVSILWTLSHQVANRPILLRQMGALACLIRYVRDHEDDLSTVHYHNPNLTCHREDLKRRILELAELL